MNTTLLPWCLTEEGHGDVDAGQGTLLLGIVRLGAYLMESSKRVQEQSAAGGGSRVPDCPLNRVSSCIYNRSDVSVTTAVARHMMLLYS